MAEVKLEGVDEIMRRLREIPKEMRTGAQSPLRYGARKGAKAVETRMKQLAPVKTGKLRNSLSVRLKPRSKTPRDALVFRIIPWKMEHIARWIEFGTGSFKKGNPITPRKKKALYSKDDDTFYGKATKGQPPQPFMRPAAEQAFAEAMSEFQKGVFSKLSTLERKLKGGNG